ncbi:MAG: hypothetical protein KDB53_16630 [Planctomycetes bacterium]|nr:hypothetical protein [Planctomycetota bacterium]
MRDSELIKLLLGILIFAVPVIANLAEAAKKKQRRQMSKMPGPRPARQAPDAPAAQPKTLADWVEEVRRRASDQEGVPSPRVERQEAVPEAPPRRVVMAEPEEAERLPKRERPSANRDYRPKHEASPHDQVEKPIRVSTHDDDSAASAAAPAVAIAVRERIERAVKTVRVDTDPSRAELAMAGDLRRAMILHEILDGPVSLRPRRIP